MRREVRGTCRQVLPVGTDVILDARKVHVAKVKEIKYQAFLVLAGSHPATPFLTLLMGGPGSTAPTTIMLPESTFYYLDLSLAVNLRGKIQAMQIIQGEPNVSKVGDHRGNRFHSEGKRRTGNLHIVHGFNSNRMVKTNLSVRTPTEEVLYRTWYSPEAQVYGGLWLKKEEAVAKEEGAQVTPGKQKKMS